MKTIKKIMAALICMTIALTGIPISVKAADSSGSMSTEMEINSELFITLVQKFLNKWTIFLFCSILFSSNQKEH